MKLSINQGPYVGDLNMGFIISVDHCQELSNLLFVWYKKLPAQICEHIEVITVNPKHGSGYKRVHIKVILSGSYVHHSQEGMQKNVEWKNEMELNMFSYSPDDKLVENIKDLEEKLNGRLRCAINAEIDSHQPLVGILSGLSNSMETLPQSLL